MGFKPVFLPVAAPDQRPIGPSKQAADSRCPSSPAPEEGSEQACQLPGGDTCLRRGCRDVTSQSPSFPGAIKAWQEARIHPEGKLLSKK